jgi:DNA-binding response OmpR family regulator
LPLAVSIFADRAHVRAEMGEDATAAGFRVVTSSDLAELLSEGPQGLGDIIVVDCPALDGAALAALARLDMRAAQSGARLIVATSLDALEDVFACLDQSHPQILVGPTRAERLVALGRAIGRAPGGVVRELSDDGRLVLLRLSEQVEQLAERLDRLSGAEEPESRRAFRFESPGTSFASRVDDDSDRLVRATRPPLPDPRLVRRIIRQRQLRGRFFDGELFADPAWDMLLDLTAARAEHQRVSVTSLCIASGVPPTTALRWIGQMTEAGLFQRVEDEADRRRAFIALTDRSADGMARYFVEMGAGAAALA